MQEPGAGRLPEAEEVSEVLREILAGPDFATFQEGAKWQFVRRLGELLSDLWIWLRQTLGSQPGVAQIVTILIVVAAVFIAVYVTRKYAPQWLWRREEEDEGASVETPVTVGEWLKLATERAGRGDFRPAATALYQGFLLTLENRGVLSFHSSKTPGDYALEIARGGGGAVPAAGGRFLDSFQDFSFGQERPTTAGYAGLARLARDAGCQANGPGGSAQPEVASAAADTVGSAGDGDPAVGTREQEADSQ